MIEHTAAPSRSAVEAELEKLQRENSTLFWFETNPANGLVIDKTAPDWPASIAATGVALRLIRWLSSATSCRVSRWSNEH